MGSTRRRSHPLIMVYGDQLAMEADTVGSTYYPYPIIGGPFSTTPTCAIIWIHHRWSAGETSDQWQLQPTPL